MVFTCSIFSNFELETRFSETLGSVIQERTGERMEIQQPEVCAVCHAVQSALVMPYPTKTPNDMDLWPPSFEKVRMFWNEFQFAETFHF